MKIAISVVVIILVIVGGFKLWEYWDRVEQEKEESKKVEDGSDIRENELPGMPWQLEQRYSQARQKGPAAVKEFLEAVDKAPKFEDPRKAWVQLDYVVMIAGSDPAEAKRIFADVKGRIRTNAPIYRRIRAMQKTYE